MATELNNRAEGGMDTAKSQLGHASSRTTEKQYVARAVVAPDVSDHLRKIGGIRGRIKRDD
ncbi:MAG: integrase [Kineosporiaceae bacterium]|nr:integrase [Aeromicrobium sp.]